MLFHQSLILQASTGNTQIATAITSLFGALAIISVFVAGLLLDLLAEYLFRPLEMRVFHRHLVRNRDWLRWLIADHKGYCEPDYEQFGRGFGESSLVKDHVDNPGDILATMLHPVCISVCDPRQARHGSKE